MLGLTDRLEPWTRRFQRATARRAAPAEPARPEPATRDRASARDDDEPPVRTGRFARRALHEQDR
jgi:hypothetical protein